MFVDKNNFVNSISSSSSNMIHLSKLNNERISNNSSSSLVNIELANAFSLVITEENLNLRKIVEKNSKMWIKYLRKNEIQNSSQLITSASYTNEYILNSENIMFLSKNLSDLRETPAKIGRVLITDSSSISTKELLNDEVLKIDKEKSEIKIFLPLVYLMSNYSHDIKTLGAILYNKYPLLSSNNKNVSENVISIKLYNEEVEEISVNNLREPIRIIFKKTETFFNNCMFFNIANNTWDSDQCETVDLGLTDYLMCSCRHLTDFTLSNYNPMTIAKDIMAIIHNAQVINGFDVFKYLTWENATVIYIFGGLLIIYFIGLMFTLYFDFYSKNDCFLIETSDITKFCSKEEVMESIVEIKEVTDEIIEQKRKQMIQKFFTGFSKEENLKNFDSLIAYLENKVRKKKFLNPDDPTESNLENNKENPRAMMMKNILGINFKNSFLTDIEMQEMNEKSKNEKTEVEVYCGGSKISIKRGIIKLGTKFTIKYDDFVSIVLNVDNSFKKNLAKNFKIKRFKIITDEKENNITDILQTTTNTELDETSINEIRNSANTTFKEIASETNK